MGAPLSYRLIPGVEGAHRFVSFDIPEVVPPEWSPPNRVGSDHLESCYGFILTLPVL